MDFRKLSRQAKRIIDKRGGTEALKGDAEELRDIARGPGSAKNKAREAAAAIKEPGAGPAQPTPPAPPQPPQPPPS
jgi:hypothetical protein